RLLASSFNSVIIQTGTGTDVVRIGTDSAPASELFARFAVHNGDDGDDQLIVDDSAGFNESDLGVVITATTIESDEVLRTLAVTHTGGVMGGGITYISSQAGDAVKVLATRAGEPLLLESGGGLDSVTIGDNGDAQQILGPVTVHNHQQFTNLVVDN